MLNQLFKRKSEPAQKTSMVEVEYTLDLYAHNMHVVMAPAVTTSILKGGYITEKPTPECTVFTFSESVWTLIGSVHYNGEFFSTNVCFDTREEAEAAVPAMEQLLRMRNLGGQE